MGRSPVAGRRSQGESCLTCDLRPATRGLSLVLLQLFQSLSEFRLPRLRLLHDRGWRIAHELFVGEPGLERRQLLLTLVDLSLRALELLLRHDALRKLHSDRE